MAKWISNTRLDAGDEDVFIAGGFIVGEPKPTDQMSREAMVQAGLVGIYQVREGAQWPDDSKLNNGIIPLHPEWYRK